MDAEDESLARWKASLGIVAGAGGGNPNGPKVNHCAWPLQRSPVADAPRKVEVVGMELASPTMPAGKKLIMDLTNPTVLKSQTFTIQEGVPYK